MPIDRLIITIFFGPTWKNYFITIANVELISGAPAPQACTVRVTTPCGECEIYGVIAKDFSQIYVADLTKNTQEFLNYHEENIG